MAYAMQWHVRVDGVWMPADMDDVFDKLTEAVGGYRNNFVHIENQDFVTVEYQNRLGHKAIAHTHEGLFYYETDLHDGMRRPLWKKCQNAIIRGE